MLFKHSVKDSKKVSGKGLFTEEFIPKGQITYKTVLEDHLVFRTEKELEDFFVGKTEKEVDDILMYSYGHHDFVVLLQDDCKFTNHSETPNTYTDYDTCVSYTLEDLPAGTEIFENYEVFPKIPFLEEACKKRNMISCSSLPAFLREHGKI